MRFAPAAGGGPVGWIVLTKAADQIVNDSTTLVDDDTLQLALVADKTYRFRMQVAYTTTAVADLKVSFQTTGSPSSVWNRRAVPRAISAFTNVAVFPGAAADVTDTISIVSASDGAGMFWCDGVITTTATGVFKLQWAQNTQQATDTTVFAGSWLEYQEI